ncbi:MAG: winged helix DNA-binding domain-containing protein [Thaumarchaeota archaeon]|nr:winged helix DNA-binding domain-containing protein [Nitrososphaerota archaeon]
MRVEDIARSRLASQGIQPDSTAKSPEEVLTSLGAVQAQDYPAALWAIGLRCGESATKADVEEAIAERRISRTWLMRGTLHFGSSRDIHWMLRLFAPGLLKTAISRDRHLGLGDDAIAKAEALFAKALKREGQLTRDQMYDVLEREGMEVSGLLGYHMLYRAAWDGIICFGAHQGKQQTFELLDDRIDSRRDLSNSEALAELATRYFTSHGPATIKDYVWWSGLKVSDAKAGIEASSGLASETVDGKTYFTKSSRMDGSERDVHLLPAFDEYLVGYADRSAMLGDADTQRMLKSGKIVFTHSNGIFLPVMVADGEVVGTWKRKNEKNRVVVAIRPFGKLDDGRRKGAREAAGRFGEFLEVDVATQFDE